MKINKPVNNSTIYKMLVLKNNDNFDKLYPLLFFPQFTQNNMHMRELVSILIIGIYESQDQIN